MENNKEIKSEIIENEKIICSKCSKEMILRKNKRTNHKFYGCSGYPDCKNIKYILEKTGKNCPKCSKDLIYRENWETKKKFVACSGYPECKYTLDIDKYNEHMEKNPSEPLPVFENKSRYKPKSNNYNEKFSKNNEKGNRKPKSKSRSKLEKQSFTGFNEKVVGVKRISKTTKGGRNMRFSALAIIGDKNGLVGYGIGKSIEVPVAIRKALKDAKNNIRKVKITKRGTLFHEIIGRQGAGKVLLKPAPEGTGIIAGGPIRVVLELAGYTDVYSKNLGKNTSINMVMATLNGLKNQKTPWEIAELRDKDIRNL